VTPDVTARSTTELFRAPAVLGIAGAGTLVLLHLRDPHESGSYGVCPFLAVTGHPCPGCGGLRAVNELTHGDVVGALSSNLLAVGLLALLVVAWAAWVARRARGTDDQMLVVRDRTLVLVLVVTLAFGVVRNTPWGVWLAP
jgi:hypothetical protein